MATPKPPPGFVPLVEDTAPPPPPGFVPVREEAWQTIARSRPLAAEPDLQFNDQGPGVFPASSANVPDYSGAFRDEGNLGDIATKAILGRIPDIVGNLAQLPANIGGALYRQAGVTPGVAGGSIITGLRNLGDFIANKVGYGREMEASGFGAPSVSGTELVEALNPQANAARRQAAVGTGEPVDELSLGERLSAVGRFIPEQLVASVPDIAATLNPATLAGYIGSRANEIAETRAANDQRPDGPSLGDLAIGGVAAPVEALLERFTTMRLLPRGTTLATPGVLPAIARIAKELGLQGALGGVEELAPYLAEQAGTAEGVSPQEALETFVGGAVAEGGLGGVVQGGKEVGVAVRAPAPPPGFVPIDDAALADQLAPEPAPQTNAILPTAPELIRDELAARRPIAPRAPVDPAQAAAAMRVSGQAQAARALQPAPEAALVPEAAPTPAAAPEPAFTERRSDVREQQRLGELRALRRSGELAPEQATELLDLTERDRVAAKVAGRRMVGVQNMEARNDAEAAGQLKPVQAFADADNFKAVNDRLGHEVGDHVIRNMGELFAAELGEGNVFHRGGDEFVLQADTPEQLDTAMARVRETLGNATLRATLADGSIVEQTGVGFSYGAGPTIQEAERAQFQDKAARKTAGLRTDRGEAPTVEPVPIRGDLGTAGQAAGESGVAAAGPEAVAPSIIEPPAEPVPRTTGTKNAAVAAERAAAGSDPILREAARTNQATVDTALETLRETPERGDEVVAKLRGDGPAGISLDDEAVLLVHKTNLRAQRNKALDTLSDAKASPEAKEVAKATWFLTEAKLDAIDQASFASGREWGRLGQFRQRMLREDFTLEAMERKFRAVTGEPLTPEQSKKIKALSQKIEELQRQADAAQAKLAQADSIAAYDDLLKKMQDSLRGKPRPTLTKLRDAANESRAALAGIESVPSRKGQSGAAINPAAFYHLSRIGAYHVANGAATFADWVAKMRSDIGAKLDEFRAMLPAVFQAAKTQAVIRADGPTVDAVLADIDAETGPTPQEVRKLIEAHVRAGLRGEADVIAAAASSLNLPEADVRRLFVQTSPKRAATLDEVKAELRDLRAVVRLQAEIDRLEAGEPRPSKGPRAAPSPAVQAKRDELDAVRQRLRDAARPDPETRYQELRGKAIAKRIADLQAKLAAGDVAKAVRVPRALSEANERAQFELAKVKEDFERLRFEAELAQRTPLAKVWGVARDTANLARAYMTSVDMSGLLRQGGFISFGRPGRAIRSLPTSLKAFASEQAEHAAMQDIQSRPNAPLYKKYGLELTGTGGGPLSKVEEAYASRWLAKMPWWTGGGIVRGSGRAYTTLLNRLRADSFDAMVATLARNGSKPTEAEGQAIANYINVATGRGKIGGTENAGEVLNTVFFAPRLVASRFQLLAGQPLYGGTARTRALIAQEYARFLTGVAITIALVAQMRDEDDPTPLIELDPRSADFGKVRFGNTFLDPLAGLAQVTTFLARVATGETKTSPKFDPVTGARAVDKKGEPAGGVVKPLRASGTLTDLRRAIGEDLPAHKLAKDGGLPFGSSDTGSVIGRFMRSKLAPVPGAIVNVAIGEDMTGEPITPTDQLTTLVTPMSFNNIAEIMEEQGIRRGTAITLLGLLGMGIQYRKPKTDDAKPDDSEKGQRG